MSELPTPQMPPRAKKLPFKPTALRKPAIQVDNDKAQSGDGLDLFRRSKEMLPIMEADRERRLRKKRKLEEQRRKAAATAGKRALEETAHDEAQILAFCAPPSAARNTTPVNVGRGSYGGQASELATPPPTKLTRLSSSPTRNIHSNSTGTASAMKTSSFASRLASPITLESPTRVPIVLSDSEDDDHAPTPTPRKNDGGGGDDDDDEAAILGNSLAATDDDDEFADYVRKAEEQRRSQALLEASRKSDAAKDSIHILVTSSVPQSKPCQMKFLYDRPLRVVKNTWLALQKQKGLLADVEDKDEIVLTWRRKKVYASSTLLNLGIRPEGNGRAVVDGSSTRGLGDNRTQVHMEVWTKAMFEDMEREEDLQRKRDLGELSDDDDDDGPASARDGPPATEVKLRVILKARGLADVKLTVRPETTVETLITGFRTQQPSAAGKDVGIWFDGDRLEEHMTIDEAEIDDLDTLEVHIK
ncbi:hypothetical protein E4U41_005466 [Claviceps citrina]|nr:hypothetical protein E4U41_005466 [Claviceps citrina]